MVNGARAALVRRGAIASTALLVTFLAAWQWGPGLLGVPSFIVPPLSSVAVELSKKYSPGPSKGVGVAHASFAGAGGTQVSAVPSSTLKQKAKS